MTLTLLQESVKFAESPFWPQNYRMLWGLYIYRDLSHTYSSKLHNSFFMSAFLSKLFDVGDLPVHVGLPTFGNWVKGWVIKGMILTGPGSVWFGLVRNRSDFDSSGSVNRKRVYGSVCDQSELLQHVAILSTCSYVIAPFWFLLF